MKMNPQSHLSTVATVACILSNPLKADTADTDSIKYSLSFTVAADSSYSKSVPRDTKDKATTEDTFQLLARQWKSATSHQSVMAKRYKHRAYQDILKLGKAAIPLILKEMQRAPDRWFHALEKLSGEDAAANAETFYEAVDKWIAWGVAHEYLECESI